MSEWDQVKYLMYSDVMHSDFIFYKEDYWVLSIQVDISALRRKENWFSFIT